MGRYQQDFRRSLADLDQYLFVMGRTDDVVKTRSEKIMRKIMRGIADDNAEMVPSTIENPAALDALRPLLHER